MTSVASPCVKLCVLDAANTCTGCFRSLDEIAAWPRADEAMRRAILDAALRRRAAQGERP
jgi:predicted Fe-S protein YdhL (DUF1289 family)